MADWIEAAKAKGQIRSGTYGHHSSKQITKDAKKGGLLGKKAVLAKTLKSLHSRGAAKLYSK